MYAPGRRWRPQQEPANPSNNHFNFKKEYFIMKKVISLVLSVMMMLTMFAGCKACRNRRSHRCPHFRGNC